MKNAFSRRALGCVAVPLLLAACDPAAPTFAERRHENTEIVNTGLSDWSNISSNMMVEKYGPPDRVETLRLVWEHRAPWKRIAVWDELGFQENDRGPNNIEETIAYPVPAEKRAALASFSRALNVSPDGAELSARSSDEGKNFLMLNLADGIVKGLLSPEDARVSYLQTLQLADSGKSSPAMLGLLFH